LSSCCAPSTGRQTCKCSRQSSASSSLVAFMTNLQLIVPSSTVAAHRYRTSTVAAHRYRTDLQYHRPTSWLWVTAFAAPTGYTGLRTADTVTVTANMHSMSLRLGESSCHVMHHVQQHWSHFTV
jgi:hypothetical protein